MKKSEEFVVITKTYDMMLWSCQHTSRFPRQHRFVLGERLAHNLYDLLETLSNPVTIGCGPTHTRCGVVCSLQSVSRG